MCTQEKRLGEWHHVSTIGGKFNLSHLDKTRQIICNWSCKSIHADPNEAFSKSCRPILRYVKGTINLGLFYKKRRKM